MSFEIRPITEEEFPAFHRAAGLAFLDHTAPEDTEHEKSFFEFDRSLAAFDAGQIVATAEIFSFTLTLPGLAAVPAGGVSWITVLPTHRRRGILTDIMRQQARDMRERGEAIGMLYASESIIYGRFGYGLATQTANYEIRTRDGGFARAPETDGRIRFVDKDGARDILPEVYDRWRGTQPGALSRSPEYWEGTWRDPERHRPSGAGARFYVVHRAESGEPDGYVTYRIKDDWNDAGPNSTMLLREIVALTPAVRASIWRFCLDMDLVRTVTAYGFPPHEPLRWMLADPRQMRTTAIADGLWIRLLDIPAALAARRYLTEDRLVFAVADPFGPENDGCYELEGSPSGADCRRVDRQPDISLQVADLGAAYLGGVSFSLLAQAGRVVENTRGTLCRADVMFASAPPAFCGSHF